MDMRSTGFLVVAAGLVLVVVGLLLAAGWLSWFGRLPGDLRVENGNVRIYVPLASMLLVSLVVSLVLALLRR
jgi:hypothetical protein